MSRKPYWLIYKTGDSRQVKPFAGWDAAETWALKRGYKILGIAEGYRYDKRLAKKISELIQGEG